MPAPETGGAEARHRIANLLHVYTGIADRKDVEAAVDLIGGTTVTFPHGGYSDPAGAREFWGALWGGPVPHRHDVSTLIVEPGIAAGEWRARAHYTVWRFVPDAVVQTLGEYTLTVREDPWRITELTVTRTWTRG